MQPSADNSSGVARLNHFISVSRETTDERWERQSLGRERNWKTEEEEELALLVLERGTFKAVIMTQKECNYFPRMPEGSECLLIVMGDNLIDARCKLCRGLNWCLSVSSLSERIQTLSWTCRQCLHPLIPPGMMWQIWSEKNSVTAHLTQSDSLQ